MQFAAAGPSSRRALAGACAQLKDHPNLLQHTGMLDQDDQGSQNPSKQPGSETVRPEIKSALPANDSDFAKRSDMLLPRGVCDHCRYLYSH